MIKLDPVYPRILADRDNYRKWYLDEPVQVELHNGHVLRIPKGYRFDAHSVPFLFRWIFPKKEGKDIYASMIHDFLIDIEMFLRYNRRFQDEVYTIMMHDSIYQTNKYRSFFMPLAVRLFGFLKFGIWGDYRGEPKLNTKVNIIVMNDTI